MNSDAEVFQYPNGVPLPPVHPGRTLASELGARGLSANALALRLRVPANRLTEIIREERSISAETALRLGRYFGTGAAFWVNLQAHYDLAKAERDFGARIAREVEGAGAAQPASRAGRFPAGSFRSHADRVCGEPRYYQSWHLVAASHPA
jgi:addiction module HigA family antidote